MEAPFLIVAVVILGGAVAAMAMRNLVHCALCAAVAFVGLAAAFLLLNAEFAGFAQILVYVGAVAILIVMALLLTRNIESTGEALSFKPWTLGLGIALLAVAGIVSALLNSPGIPRAIRPEPTATVKGIGDLLLTRYVVAFEVLGLLLTAALIGAVILALKPREEAK